MLDVLGNIITNRISILPLRTVQCRKNFMTYNQGCIGEYGILRVLIEGGKDQK